MKDETIIKILQAAYYLSIIILAIIAYLAYSEVKTVNQLLRENNCCALLKMNVVKCSN